MRLFAALLFMILLAGCNTTQPAIGDGEHTSYGWRQDFDQCRRQPELRQCVVECQLRPYRDWCNRGSK